MATEINTEEAYREYLDETYPVVEIEGVTYRPARIVEEVDPTAFAEGHSAYVDAMVKSRVWFQDENETVWDEEEDEEDYSCDICGLDH